MNYSQYDDDGYAEGASVLVQYPLPTDATGFADRPMWPWLPGTVLERCGYDEWYILVTAPELAEFDPDESDEPLYPTCFRDRDEIRPVG